MINPFFQKLVQPKLRRKSNWPSLRNVECGTKEVSIARTDQEVGTGLTSWNTSPNPDLKNNFLFLYRIFLYDKTNFYDNTNLIQQIQQYNWSRGPPKNGRDNPWFVATVNIYIISCNLGTINWTIFCSF